MKRLTIWGRILALAIAVSFISSVLKASSAWATGSVTPSIGDTVIFGQYDQGNGCDGEYSPIEWMVLDTMDGKLLLLSKDGLETGPYNNTKKRATWADCSLREWLNCDFLYSFSEEEIGAIRDTIVSTPGGCFTSPATGENITIASCPDTQDLVFLLNVEEVSTYFPKASQRKARNTDYLLDKPEREKPYPAEGDPCDFSYGNWWLRDVRDDNGIKSAFHVKSYGNIASAGQVNLKRYVIRPAMWVDASYPFEIGD